MLTRIRAINFQSLRDVNLELGRFTVLVGPSSSGKSAVMRAVKAVVSNGLSSDYISRGTKAASVSVEVNDTTITIERSSNESSSYKIVESSGKESRYTELNRQVPAQVAEALGISSSKEVAPINFAGQFDTPYLLTEGGSSVARVLGELTNVSTIFDAVKEANRRSRNASALLKLRKKDEAQLLEDLKSYATIGVRAKDVSSAEQTLAHCTELDSSVQVLSKLIVSAEKAEATLEKTDTVFEIPDLSEVLTAQNRLLQYSALLKEMVSSSNSIRSAETAINSARQDHDSAKAELHDLLVTLGQCPTCNQKIE